MAKEQVYFDNLSAMIECAEREPTRSAFNLSRNKEENYGRKSMPWSGTYDWQEAVNLATFGWNELRAGVEEAFGPIATEIRDAIPEQNVMVHDVTGAAVDIDAYLRGEPESMIEFVQEPVSTQGRVITIITNVSVSCTVDSERMVKRGVGIAALCYALNLLQHSTEIYVEAGAEYWGGRDNSFSCVTKVKSAQNAEDIDNIMFALAHPSMLRRLYFAVFERRASSSLQKLFGHGYGSPSGVTRAEEVDATIVIDNQGTDIRLLESNPAEWVREQLRKLGLMD